MKIIHAQFLAYRDSDGELSTDKYIRAIMDDGHDLMILAKPFIALRDYLENGGEVLQAEPIVEVNHVNLEMVKGAAPIPVGPVAKEVPVQSEPVKEADV